MNSNKKTPIIVGVLFIIGTVSGILSVVFTAVIFDDPNLLVAVSENQLQLIVGAFFVLTMAFALVMIPVVMFPLFKKQNEPLALGAVVFRGTLEGVTYMAIVICWLLLVTLGREYVQAGSPDASYFHSLGTMVQEAEKWIGLLLNIVFSLGALMIYTLFYQSRLVPRWLSGWGLVGAILYLASPLIVMFGPQNSTLSLTSGVGFLMIPLAVQEMVLAGWLIVKGFNSPVIGSPSTAQLKMS